MIEHFIVLFHHHVKCYTAAMLKHYQLKAFHILLCIQRAMLHQMKMRGTMEFQYISYY